MRKTSWIALAALFAASAALGAPQTSQQSSSPQSSQAPSASSSASAQQQDSLAAAARKAREQQKKETKAVKVFDNDNLPTQGGISTVGEASAPAKNDKTQTAASTPAAGKLTGAQWSAKFSALRQKLQQDQDDLSILRRELGQQSMQYYNGDPQKAAQDQASGHPMGEQYNKTQAKIDAKQKQVDADQQAISDAETALRQAGGDPGWAR